MEKIRLQKFISECGIMSRRSAEAEIAAGHVNVNGLPASLGDKVDVEHDTVELGGKVLVHPNSGTEDCRNTYIILNKPVGYVTTLSDEQGRKTIADLISDIPTRLYPVGRLDMYSDGLLICTNDGDMTNRITHPSHDVPKDYLAVITEHLDEDKIRALSVPLMLDGYMLRPFEVNFVKYTKVGQADSTVVKFTLHEGRNREIRKICAHHGLKLARLTRISIGEIKLGELKSGKWRHLSDEEIQYLKKI